MADDVGATDRNRSLNDLQTYYDRKKREIREKGDSEVQQLEQTYKEKTQNVIDNGEAAVNHIRAMKQKQVDQIAQQSTMNLEGLRENQKARVASEIETEQVQDVNLNKERQKHQQVMEKQHETMSADESQLRKETSDRQEALNKQYARELNDGKNRLYKLKESQTDQLIKVREENDTKLGREMNSGREELRSLKAKTNQTVEGERTQERQNLDRLRQQDEAVVKNERNRGEQERELVRDMQTHNMQTVEDRGAKAFDAQKQRQTTLMDKQHITYEKQQEEMKSAHQRQLAELAKAENSDYTERAHEYEARKEKQLNNFQSQYKLADQQDVQALGDQKENLVRALNNQKSLLYRKVKRYSDMQNDPFYRILDMDSNLHQTDNAYVFTTHIAPQDRDNIDVRVQKDKIVVTGQRQFQDSLEDEGKTLKTSSYQTIHQEHHLDHPVREMEAAKSYHDGVLTVIVPKA